MKLCYFDAFSGISGDMTVGALLDAGASSEALIDALLSLNTGARFAAQKTKRAGITATKFCVEAEPDGKHRHLPHILKMIDAGNFSDRAKRNAAAVFQKLG